MKALAKIYKKVKKPIPELLDYSISIPPGGSTSVAVPENAKVIFQNMDFEKVRIDIVDSDVIITNPEDGSRIILPGMALLLYEPLMSELNSRMYSPMSMR